MFYVDLQGPAYRAGIRQGDTVVPTSGVAAVYDSAGTAGTTIAYKVIRKDGVHLMRVTFVPFSGALAVQEQVNKVVGALTALAAFIVAILVAVRARERTAGTRAAGLLSLPV